jgi:signal transduction histidine kinase
MRFLAVFKGNRLVLPLACSAALAMLAINEFAYWNSSQAAQNSLSVVATQKIIGQLHTRTLEAETGQRGYLLTGRKEYLQPYEASLSQIQQSFVQLQTRYANDPDQIKIVEDLKTITQSKLSEMALTIDLQEKGQNQASLDLVLSDSGWQKMQRMRALTDALVTNEESNLLKSQEHVLSSLTLNRVGVAALAALSLVALILYLRQTLLRKQQQLELQRLVGLERDQLEDTVRSRTKQLTELARYLQTAREDERSRLARDLHDDLGALLTSAKLDAARIKSRVGADSPEANALLVHLAENLNSSIALGRKIIEDLRPSALSNLGLVATLEILAREFAESSGLQVHGTFAAVSLPPDSELMVYRLMQEACTNILKYAKATNVWMDLSMQEGVVTASVRDDGVGYDVSTKLGTSYGLLGMRYRVEAANGVLDVKSELGVGTLVRARI